MAQSRRQPFSRRTAFDRFIPFRPNLDVDASNARLNTASPEAMEKKPAQYRDAREENYRKLLSKVFYSPDGKVLPITKASTPTATGIHVSVHRPLLFV